MVRLIARKLIDAAQAAGFRRDAVNRLPRPLVKILRHIKRFAEQDRYHAHTERHDHMIQLLEQRIIRDFEVQTEHMRRDILDRQDNMMVLIEQQMVCAIDELKQKIRNEQSGLLDDASYMRFQIAMHDASDKSGHYNDLIQRLMPDIQENSLALDIGCGSGGFLESLRENGRYGIGIDKNEDVISVCQRKDLDVKHGDAVEILQSSEPESCDAVIALHVFEHLNNHDLLEIVRQSYRVLKPSGVLIIETPKIASLPTLIEHYFADPTHQTPRHHSLYGFVCTEHGFQGLTYEDCNTAHTGALVVEPATDQSPPTHNPPEITDEMNPSGEIESVRARLDSIASTMEENFRVLNESIYVPRDILIVARKTAEIAAPDMNAEAAT